MGLLAHDQVLGGHVTGIHDLFGGEQLAGGQVGLNRGQPIAVGRGGRGSLDSGDQVHRVLVARFGEMHFLNDPDHAALLGVARFGIIGRTDQPGRRGQI